ncbi:hypothetical protein EVAR_66312_1 [Eumeta japonica]|uniref:Uncharacterized protein n=1 Tax=Eumeta variegata TaxID=151549 RepID=A0A4C1ZX06_EUMVA|nr:hypothetical protein EVAR_66312_1 [Eumeta japonica]
MARDDPNRQRRVGASPRYTCAESISVYSRHSESIKTATHVRGRIKRVCFAPNDPWGGRPAGSRRPARPPALIADSSEPPLHKL